jgi:hypothetical protein
LFVFQSCASLQQPFHTARPCFQFELAPRPRGSSVTVWLQLFTEVISDSLQGFRWRVLGYGVRTLKRGISWGICRILKIPYPKK